MGQQHADRVRAEPALLGMATDSTDVLSQVVDGEVEGHGHLACTLYRQWLKCKIDLPRPKRREPKFRGGMYLAKLLLVAWHSTAVAPEKDARLARLHSCRM